MPTVTGLDDKIYEVSSGESTCVDVSSLAPGSFDVDNVSNPILRRLLPESTWDATFYSDGACGATETETFQGSSSGCHLVTDLLQSPGHVAPESNSVLIKAEFGTYDFSFFPNEGCQITGLNDEIYEVTSGESLCVAYTDAVSFNVEDVTAASSKRSSIASVESKRSPVPQVIVGPGPESIWNLTTFGAQQCEGNSIQNFHGSGSASCKFGFHIVYAFFFSRTRYLGCCE